MDVYAIIQQEKKSACIYGDRHMVKGQSDSKRGNSLQPLYGLLFSISSKRYLYALSHRQVSTYHGLCYISRGALAVMI